MSDDTTILGKVRAFFANAQVQSTLRAAFALGGPAYLWFSGHLGLNDQQIGLVYQALIMFGPGAVAWIISMVQKTHSAIVAKAAQILADRHAGAVVISPGAPKSMAVMANDSTVPNVVPAGSDAAIKVATNQ